jgi:hypothetical protein
MRQHVANSLVAGTSREHAETRRLQCARVTSHQVVRGMQDREDLDTSSVYKRWEGELRPTSS